MSTVNSTTSSDVINNLQKTSSTGAPKAMEMGTQSSFLRLLTEQLKNQDPLSPMDNAQMTSQLAQISTVDGLGKLNTTLSTLLESSQSGEAMQAAALVGKGVMVSGNGLSLSSGKAYGGFELTSPADKVSVTIKDSNGLEVRTLELGDYDAGVFNFAWDGLTNNGSKAVDGSYSLSVKATRGDTSLSPTALQLGSVNSVLRTSAGSVSIDVGGGKLVTLSDIKQIL